jgi:hypothetical protein
MLDEPAAEVVQIALESLNDIGAERLRSCIAAFITSPDESVRLAVLRVAQRLDGDAARPFFLYGALDASAKVRRRTVLYLGWRDDEWVPTVLRSLCNDGDPLVRWRAMRALAVKDPGATRELLGQPSHAAYPGYRRLVTRLVRAQPTVSGRSLLRPAGDPTEGEREGSTDTATLPPQEQAPSSSREATDLDGAGGDPDRTGDSARGTEPPASDRSASVAPGAHPTVPPKATESTIPRARARHKT